MLHVPLVLVSVLKTFFTAIAALFAKDGITVSLHPRPRKPRISSCLLRVPLLIVSPLCHCFCLLNSNPLNLGETSYQPTSEESCASPSKSSDVQSDASTTATPPKDGMAVSLSLKPFRD